MKPAERNRKAHLIAENNRKIAKKPKLAGKGKQKCSWERKKKLKAAEMIRKKLKGAQKAGRSTNKLNIEEKKAKMIRKKATKNGKIKLKWVERS